jgi:alpha-1,2-mannosyltransferase
VSIVTDERVAVAAVLLSLGIGLWQLSLRGVFGGVIGSDDGVYLGAALRLVTGALPYRDFVFAQPPGIAVLMSPIALIGRAVGSLQALEIARVVTALVASANAGLVAWMARPHGRVAMAIAGGLMATFPLAVAADATLYLEPYLVLFVLLGSLAAFGRAAPTPGRLILAGALFGIAGSIKIWAALPLLALFVSFLPKWRSMLHLFVGAAAGFGLVCLPFVIAAPGAFYHQVVVDQLSRPSSISLSYYGGGLRLVAITGLLGISQLPASPALAETLLAVIGLAVLITFVVAPQRIRRRDVYVVLAAIATVVGLVEAPSFYNHYPYFSAPFLALLVGISVPGIVGRIAWRARRSFPLTRRTIVALGAVAWILGIGAAIFAVSEDTMTASSYLSSFAKTAPSHNEHPEAAIDAAIPKGSCAVFDQEIVAVVSNRVFSSSANCPDVVDTFGTWLAYGGGKTPPAVPPYPAAFVDTWRSYFERAQFVVLSYPETDRIPFDSSLVRWFKDHFRLVVARPGTFIYRNRHFGG